MNFHFVEWGTADLRIRKGSLRTILLAVSLFLTKDYIPGFLIWTRGNNMGDKKYFVLMSGGKDTSQVFASRQPRGAALKAATRGATDIRLRERGTKKVHVFKGSVSMVDKPANGPDWLPDKIKKANVKKVGIEHL